MFLVFFLFILLFDATLSGLTVWPKKMLTVDRPLRRDATLETRQNANFGYQEASVSVKGARGASFRSAARLSHAVVVRLVFCSFVRPIGASARVCVFVLFVFFIVFRAASSW